MDDIASSGVLRLVNRKRTLGADFVPEDLAAAADYGIPVAAPGIRLQSCACAALAKLMRQALDEGAGEIVLFSGYRSYSEQKRLHEDKIRRLCCQGMSLRRAQAAACTVVAPPGASEHQLGLAADVTVPAFLSMKDPLIEAFADTPQGVWLAEKAAETGFVLRYPADKQESTGVCFEPWHLRYVGEVHAERMRRGHMCLEEYLYAC